MASIGDAVIATDNQDRVTFLNGEAERLTGWRQAEVVGQPVHEVFRITRLPAEDLEPGAPARGADRMQGWLRFTVEHLVPVLLIAGLNLAPRLGYFTLLPLPGGLERAYGNLAVLFGAAAALVVSVTFSREEARFDIPARLGTMGAGLVTVTPWILARAGLTLRLPPQYFDVLTTFAYLGFFIAGGVLIGGCWFLVARALGEAYESWSFRGRAEATLVEWVNQRELRRSVLRLALPIVGSDLLQRGVNVVDALLVGRLGAAELAAVGLSQLLLTFMMALVYGLGVGTTVMVAFHTGATDVRRRAWAVRTSLLIGAVATVGLGGAGLLLSRSVASFMGAEDRLLDLTLEYLHVTWYLFGGYVCLHLASAVFQGAGDTRTPLRAMMGVNVLHVLVAVPLVYGLAGLPRLGVVGAALASGLSEGAGAAWLLWQAKRRGFLGRRSDGWDFQELWRILRVGLPAVGERLITNGMQLIFASIVIGFGVAAYAAHQVGLNIESLSWLPGLGFAKAATMLVGQRLGAKDPRGARPSVHQANVLATGIMTALGASFVLFPRTWVALFTSDPDVLAYSVPLLTALGLLQAPLAIGQVMSGGLRGAGETQVVLMAAIVGGWFIRLPLAYIGGVSINLGMTVVWASMVLDWIVRCGIVSWRFRRLSMSEVRL